MTDPSASRQRRRRGIRTRTLVLVAVVACLALLIGRGTVQFLNRFSCIHSPRYVEVSVSTDIEPAIQRIAGVFNNQHHQVGGKCVSIHVDATSSAQAMAQIDGTHRGRGPKIDAWIPDSSLWVDQARGFAVGATTVQPAGFSVAHSPLMIVAPSQAAAAKIRAFGTDGWRLLLPHSAGGPIEPIGFRVDLPDPTQSAAGLATLIQVSRTLGVGKVGRVKFTKFVYSSEVTPYFDDPVSLKYFVSLAAPPLDGLPVTTTTEQAVLSYDAANPRAPLAATYPTGTSDQLGSPEFDYPYVITTADPFGNAAVKAFGQMLTTPYARSVIRFAGFRTGPGSGVPDQVPTSYGLADQLLQVAPASAASEAPTVLQIWNKLALGSRFLSLVDVSSTMAKPADPTDPTGPTIEQDLTQTASLGLALFPDTARIGLWEFANHMTGKLPYKALVPVGPLGSSHGVITRRDELQRINIGLQPTGGPQLALYGSILAGYQYMQRTYQKNFQNSVVVLTSGQENAPGDISARLLLRKLSKIANPTQKISIVIIVFGNPPDFSDLSKIATLTGGQAYKITNPKQIGKVFFEAIAHRLCDPNCVSA